MAFAIVGNMAIQFSRGEDDGGSEEAECNEGIS